MSIFRQQRSVLGEADPTAGDRADGKKKGRGWLGEIPTSDGKKMTEMSIGVELDGREVNIPLLVPSLNRSEIELLRQGNPPNDEIVRKAVDFAKDRMKHGYSPYFD
jgi:hypothetical protein